ncbi:MAG TPA: AAA family ATPase [Ktedonobacterales bacterium]|jgi:transcriptional regulator with XRE-family HTH domain/tetratricopeptide (TPR) repeat protein|nr:AAA family ATPase [Ktedonobacterales bacterium]
MDTNEYPRFGELLRAHRHAANLTQEQLAVRAGVSVNAIGDLERGRNRSAHQATVERLANALELQGAVRDQLFAARRFSTPLFGAPGTSPRSDTLQLIGRSTEQAQIQRLLQGSGPPMLAFYGEPGVGKSRLLQEAEEQARRMGWTTLRGGCQQSDAQHPYTPVFQALERHVAKQTRAERSESLRDCKLMTLLLHELADVAPPPQQPWKLPPEQERRLLFAAVGRYLANVAGPSGVLLILDDLQWAEPDGLLLLYTLLHSAVGNRHGLLRVVAASHETHLDDNHPLRRLRQDLAHDRLLSWTRLTPLDVKNSEALLRAALEGATVEPTDQRESLIRHVLARCAGVPFYLTSFAREIRDGMLSGPRALGDGNIPWDIAELIRRRVQSLPETTRDLLAIAAVYGRETPLYVLALTTDLPERQVIEAIELACQEQLMIETDTGACAFKHDLIREVILAEQSNARRTMLHQRIEAMLDLQVQEGTFESGAFYSSYSASADVSRAVRHLEQAGDRAQSVRADIAADARYQDALRLLAPSAADLTTARLHSKRGELLLASGKYDLALDCFEAMATCHEQVGNLDGMGQAAAQIGWAHVRRGSAKQGLARIEPLLAPETMARMTLRTQAALHCAHAILLFALSQYAAQLSSAREACALARAIGDQAALARGLRLQGLALVLLGRLVEAAPVQEETLRVAESAGDLDSYSAALNDAAAVFRARGDLRLSWSYSERALEAIQQLGDPMGAAFLSSSHGENAMLLGHWTTARRCYERAVEIVREMGVSWVASYPLANLGYLNLLEGHEEAAGALLREALAHAESHQDMQALRHVHGILAERDLMAGAALDAWTRIDPLIDHSPVAEKESTGLLPLLAWAHVALGRRDHAAQALSLCQQQVDRTGVRLVGEDALLVQARLSMYNGDFGQASQAIQQAVARARDMGWPHAEAKALSLQGSLLALRDERTAARAVLNGALAIFDKLGERLYSREAITLLQRLDNAAS